jgi:hypothetical protein
LPFADVALLAALVLLAATVYSSVGHAGASGYVAAMALMGLAPAVMKPTALTLNILVATLATYRWHYAKNGIRWKALLPLMAGSVPMAFIGGAIQLPGAWYKTLVGIVLLLAGLKLVLAPRTSHIAEPPDVAIPLLPGVATGGSIGLLSGLTGTGGGIFLSPILLFLRWTGTREASGITAPFILVNSAAGLAGNLSLLRGLPDELPFFIVAALLGGVLGTQIGFWWASISVLQRILGVVLIVAGAKFALI